MCTFHAQCKGVNPFCKYQFRVCAVNEAGLGEFSEPTPVLLVRDPIGMIIYVFHTIHHEYINPRLGFKTSTLNTHTCS